MEQLWSDITSNYSPFWIEFVGTLVVQILSFWIPSVCYILLDYFFPSFSQRHKLQAALKQPTRKDLYECLKVVLGNQLLTSALHLILLLFVQQGNPTYQIIPTLPSYSELIRDILLSVLLREALFYYSHRLLHSRYFYSRIHKQHHRFTAPIALAAQYAHPLEQICANALPISLPPQLLGSHILTFWIFLGYELVNTATVHSGYDFLDGKARMHDAHHERFNLNYGSIGLLDWIHGTDRLRKRSD
ncbi:fatty acid hydroxylase superfamily-domain-containing protein [Aspergillus heterothallicus]